MYFYGIFLSTYEDWYEKNDEKNALKRRPIFRLLSTKKNARIT